MNRSTVTPSSVVAVLLAATLVSPAFAQGTTAQGVAPSTPPSGAAPKSRAATPANTAATERREGSAERQVVVDAAQLESGANSFTEAQARSRFEDAGFTNVQDLRKDDHGFWHGRAMRGGSQTEVALDFRGRIAAGPAVATLRSGNTRSSEEARTNAIPSAGTTNREPDGTAGNPPSTMTGRAVDRLQGETPRPDGTPGNPPGTAAGRALDRATGTNTTGANHPAAGSGAPQR
ncbi:hypothetical protein [Paracraurococcus lichenis]|uniref:PepSY domain-containing protein n=1 Tax=Paracraurococcus lichenis TaxID=3064888 RepID=A0ABT9EEB9_9PROT|nr:hypothetical protein [Paracraurococcus sp. LOR1-02]MDO9714434.1 hypothetical protein [Paracraurococcus sp. LOR1-02]